MLGMLKKKLTESMNQFSGNKDFLEAVCAAAALVAAADGTIEDSEIETTVKTIAQNPTLSGSFSRSEIEKTTELMLRRAQGGRSGRFGLYGELDDIAGNADMAEPVYLCALDVSEADGEIDDEERKVLNQICERLGLNPKNYEV